MRHALFGFDRNDELQLGHPTNYRPGEKWSEHGLGHVLNRSTPKTKTAVRF